MKSTIITAIFLAIATFAFSQNSFEIHGDIKGLDNEKVLFLKILGESFETEIVEVHNGKFSIKGELDEPYFVQIMPIKNGTENEAVGKLAEFILEASKIYVVGCSKAYEDVKVYGSEADKVLKAYFMEDELLTDRFLLLQAQRKTYEEKGALEKAAVIKKEMYQIAKVDRIALLKSYVKDHKNTIIGALLPNFCTMDNVLSNEDYREIYNTLSPANQKTAFGQSILIQAEEEKE